MQETYANYAFISYSHKDEPWAAWLQRKLESYRLPSVIRREAGSTVPERIRPVFRDATDLGAGRLQNNLQHELESSRFLIVICSPNSARPNAEGKHWVNDEVSHFASLGRADRIVPILVEGDEKSSLCPKLRELGILAIDATKKSRQRTLNDLVAALLGLRPDELWQREERLRRRKAAWRMVVAATALILAGLGGWRWYDVGATHVQYYSDYVDEWGIPTGIPNQLLTREQVRNRLFSYRFEFRGRQKGGGLFAPRILRRVVMADADGRTLNDESIFFSDDPYYLNRPQIQLLHYREDGGLEYIDDRDGKNLPLVRHKFSGRGNGDVENVQIIAGGEIDAPLLANSLGKEFGASGDAAERSEIRRLSHTRDSRGRIVKTLFKADRGRKARNAEGVYGIAYERDADGRPVKETYLGYGGTPHENRLGTAGCVRSFSGDGFLDRFEFVDAYGKTKINGNSGYAQEVFHRDEYGNCIRRAALDAAGVPTLNNDGISGEAYTIVKGRLTRSTFLDIEDRPTLTKNGYAAACLEWEENGDSLTIRFLDDQDAPTHISWGCAKWHLSFRDGDLVLFELHDLQGHLTPNGDGNAGYRSEWKNHRETKRIFFDENRCPMSGYSVEYNDDGQEMAYFNLGEDELPKDGPQGWAGRLTEYEEGHPVRVRFVDPEGNLILTTAGHAGWNSIFENGNEIERTFIGEDGRPVLVPEGYATQKQVYKNGLLISYSFLGLDGEPVLHKDGNAGARYKYDDAGRITEYTWFGLTGEPVRSKGTGAIGWRSKYDDAGNEIERWWLGPDGNPCRNADGIAGWKTSFDSQNREIERMFVDADGKPVILPNDGTAGIRWEYDNRGNTVSKTFLGPDGKETICFDGYSSEHDEYNTFGNITRHMCLGTNGVPIAVQQFNGCAGWEIEFDRFQRETKTTYIGTNGNPMIAGRGFASYEFRRDNLGRVTGERYYDAAGKLTLRPEDLVAGWDDEYDVLGNLIRRTYVGTDGNPCRHIQGNAGWKAKYDRRGNILEFVYVDEQEQPLPLNLDGIAGHRSEYDDNNNEIRHVNLGTDEKPKMNFEGWAEWTKRYDQWGTETEQRFFDETGTPCLLPNLGYAGWTKETTGNVTTTFYLGLDGKPTRTKDGWAGTREMHDERGNVESLVYLDLDGARFETGAGCAEIVSTFDEIGFRTRIVYLDADGHPVPAGVDRSCGQLSWSHEIGKESKRIYLGPDGNPGINDTGAFGAEFSFDWAGRQTSWTPFDQDGMPILEPSLGYAKVLYEFNDDNSCYTSYFDEQDNPAVTIDGIAAEISLSNAEGLEVAHRCFGLDGQLIPALSSGVAGWDSGWNERGNEIRRTWIGTNGEPAPHRDGNTGWTSEYDERGRMIQRTFVDASGKPVDISDGIAGRAWEYDDAGNITKVVNLDEDGIPMDDVSGTAIEILSHDLFGRLVKVQWLDSNGQPVWNNDTGCAGYQSAYDIYGNETNRVWIGVDGKPHAHKDGNAGWCQRFERGLCVSTIFTDTNGTPTAIPDGYAEIRVKHDRFGRMTELWYLDTAGNPCSATNGCSRMHWSYDERGLCTEYEELDMEGQLFTNTLHDAVKYTYEYDRRGHETICRFIDADGKLRNEPHGFAIREQTCDFAGRPTEVRFLDADGKSVRNTETDASIERREWDDRGNLVCLRYFDENDVPCLCSNGYATVKTEYDLRGFSVKTLHYGPDDTLVALSDSGCAGWTSKRDRLGNETVRIWLGTDGNATPDHNGVFGWTSIFAHGQETSRRWIGADGKPCRAADGSMGWDKTYDEYGKELSKIDVN